MLGIALKGQTQPTYQQSLNFGKAVAPAIFDTDQSLLGRTKEDILVSEYRQRAEAATVVRKQKVEPVDLVDKDIEENKSLLHTGGENNLIKRRVDILERVRTQLLPKTYTENQLILRDVFKIKRDLPVPPQDGDTYRDYELAKGRGLRIRMLHPDPPEHAIGADLIYEQYWDAKKLARVVAVQYKIWNGKSLYLSQATNLEQQLKKLESIFCANDLCKAYANSKRIDAYRLPFCAAFLRPTDKLQSPDSQFVSKGLYVPICVVQKQLQDPNSKHKILERKRIRSESLSHAVFEELFNINMLGSKWLTYSEIEQLYKIHGLFNNNDRIILHAQEYEGRDTKNVL